jgi:hypothetical protein
MQPYFDPTRKTTSKKKWKTTSKKMKNLRRPQKKNLKNLTQLERRPKKMEDDLKKK